MIPHVDGGCARRRCNHPDQTRRDRALDVDGKDQRHERDQEHAAANPQVGAAQSREERREGQQEEDLDGRHAGR